MIYILVPTYARVDETKYFLESIRKSIDDDYLVVIIDDHPDNITYRCIEESRKIRILKPKKELWWVGSINLGIRTIFNNYHLKDKDMVVFANNDMTIDQSSFKIIQEALRENPNQIVHPKTFDQNNQEVSSGAKVLSFFPYITKHPKGFSENNAEVDMGTARFLCMTAQTLEQVGFINRKLVQYLGDNDFTLRAKRKYNISTYVLRDAVCRLDDTQTGMKNTNIKTINELWQSFFSIRSPNNIKYRYILFQAHFNSFNSFFITVSMTFNALMKFIAKRIV